MTVKEILLLGNPKLYEVSESVMKQELKMIRSVVKDLNDTLMDFRKKYNSGRAIAAPQIGVMKRLIYMNIDDISTIIINPVLKNKSDELIEVWDDCMCFPDLLVRVLRHKSIQLIYRDLEWNEKVMNLKGDLSELLQHEYDHLNGILAVSKAINGESFTLRSQKKFL